MTKDEGMIEDIQHEAPLGKIDHCMINIQFKCYTERTQIAQHRFVYDKGDSCPILDRNESITRSNAMKLYKTIERTKLRQHNFTNRITESWNILPEEVITAKTVNTCNKFWKDQDVLFCFGAKLKTSCSHKTKILSADEDLDI